MVKANYVFRPWYASAPSLHSTFSLISTRFTDLATGTSVLDHDTNVFFTLPSGASASLYQLDLNTITNAASGSAIAWEAVSSTSFEQGSGQGAVMAEASNHISMLSGLVRAGCLRLTLCWPGFFNVPSNPAGSADMFVIHCKHSWTDF